MRKICEMIHTMFIKIMCIKILKKCNFLCFELLVCKCSCSWLHFFIFTRNLYYTQPNTGEIVNVWYLFCSFTTLYAFCNVRLYKTQTNMQTNEQNKKEIYITSFLKYIFVAILSESHIRNKMRNIKQDIYIGLDIRS